MRATPAQISELARTVASQAEALASYAAWLDECSVTGMSDTQFHVRIKGKMALLRDNVDTLDEWVK